MDVCLAYVQILGLHNLIILSVSQPILSVCLSIFSLISLQRFLQHHIVINSTGQAKVK